MKKTTKKMIDIMEHFANGGEVEIFSIRDNAWVKESSPSWNWFICDYRKKEYEYPMWFKNNNSDLIVRFDGLQKGEVIVGNKFNTKNTYRENWTKHTDKEFWTQVDEPKLEQKVTIEKWLVKIDEVNCIVEVDNIDLWISNWDDVARISKVQLVDSYEITIK